MIYGISYLFESSFNLDILCFPQSTITFVSGLFVKPVICASSVNLLVPMIPMFIFSFIKIPSMYSKFV